MCVCACVCASAYLLTFGLFGVFNCINKCMNDYQYILTMLPGAVAGLLNILFCCTNSDEMIVFSSVVGFASLTYAFWRLCLVL